MHLPGASDRDEEGAEPRLLRSSSDGGRAPSGRALWFDGSGWCALAKRLEAVSFQLPPLDGDQTQVSIDGSTFASLLAGIAAFYGVLALALRVIAPSDMKAVLRMVEDRKKNAQT